jgi:hypothetical protein
MKNVVYSITVDTTQQLWQHIKDPANEICSDVVLMYVFMPMKDILSICHNSVTSKSSVSQEFHVSEVLEHNILEIYPL